MPNLSSHYVSKKQDYDEPERGSEACYELISIPELKTVHRSSKTISLVLFYSL